MTWPFRRRSTVVNPVGWDEQHQRVHDVGFQVDGALMHYSTCWCRQPCACHASQTSAPVDVVPDARPTTPSAQQASAPTDLATSTPDRAVDVAGTTGPTS